LKQQTDYRIGNQGRIALSLYVIWNQHSPVFVVGLV